MAHQNEKNFDNTLIDLYESGTGLRINNLAPVMSILKSVLSEDLSDQIIDLKRIHQGELFSKLVQVAREKIQREATPEEVKFSIIFHNIVRCSSSLLPYNIVEEIFYKAQNIESGSDNPYYGIERLSDFWELNHYSKSLKDALGNKFPLPDHTYQGILIVNDFKGEIQQRELIDRLWEYQDKEIASGREMKNRKRSRTFLEFCFKSNDIVRLLYGEGRPIYVKNRIVYADWDNPAGILKSKSKN